MNKRDFEKQMNSKFSSMPLDKVEKEIQKMQSELTKMKNVWLPEFLQKKLKGHVKCQKCGKYSKEKDFKIETEVKVNVETTYTDCGYGDDDKFGEVERLWVYQICPVCKNKQVKSKNYIRTIREWSRK